MTEMPLSAEAYLEGLFKPDAVLERVKEGIRENGMPEISIAPGYGRLLTMLTRLVRAEQVLEIGALGGYSGICLARGLSAGGKLVSLELKQEYADLAHKHLREAGLGDKVEYRIGEALDSLEALSAEGRRFDLFFIDADKGNYPNYLEWAIKLARPGALILGDNLLMRGKTTDPEQFGNAVTKMRQFNESVARDPRLEGVLLPAYDGLAIARVRG
ncbi:Predicted O-methyltransferase YrrM [Paenibacillus tianmuensis]|uniref:Predicted O-methyltransferase YrrM n=1 Tax=Paenibacillus tianmuensis TaxID=624147 RepID=A0A1G4RRR3_9BACL|nr:O-methyltransferase [Paenibacillus tianmuensis]SCW59486.1 Predicted O-methyltransferase YrrM [Paenibacillus tianmuensis]